ncbi:MAG: ribosome biogenesis GTP-binding protein YihA/YsxC [Bacteroidota bacterium]
MTINESEYIGSFPRHQLCPKEMYPEYAFIGRSNVGKSSLINMLCDRKELARTSKKPGKTQMINYYLINQEWGIVDLPGYGYAKISKKMRLQWREMIEQYLLKREQLQCAFVLIDANVPPQNNDIEFINWLGKMGVPFLLIYTKIDRLKPIQLPENIQKIENALLAHWEELPQQFYTSSNEKKGRAEILDFLESINEDFWSKA